MHLLDRNPDYYHPDRIPDNSAYTPVSELHVCLLAGVVTLGFGQLLGDHQLRNVHAITQQVRDGLLSKLHCSIWIPYWCFQNYMQK